MRVIKFRAWDGKQMHKDVNVTGGIASVIEDAPDGVVVSVELKNQTIRACSDWAKDVTKPAWNLMQFTGLTDANGVEIYEGDVVDCNLVTDKGVVEDHRGKVFFDDFEYVVETQDNLWPVASWQCVSRCEVIGNIHQNPELLTS